MFCNCKCSGYSENRSIFEWMWTLVLPDMCIISCTSDKFWKKCSGKCSAMQEYLKTVINDKPIFVNFGILPLIHSLAYIWLPVAVLQQCAPRKCSWVSKAHIDVSQPFTASECRLIQNWGFGSLAMRNFSLGIPLSFSHFQFGKPLIHLRLPMFSL